MGRSRTQRPARRRRTRRLTAWPPLPPRVWVTPPRTELPYPLGAAGCRLFARGRHALWHGLRALDLAPGDAILTPAYHHGSEIEVMRRLGLECRFYPLDERLEPEPGGLDALVDRRVRALQIIHYLGQPQNSARWRRWCDDRGLLLIEDAAMAWLAQTPAGAVGTHGDVAIFCLYKSFGPPAGAALVARAPPTAPAGRGPTQLRAVAGLHATWLSQQVGLPGAPPAGSAAPYDPAADFALGDADAPIGAATRWLLPRIADAGAAASRRANARILIDGLAGRVPPPFDAPAAGAAPFTLPVRTSDKAALIARLAPHGIEALDLWSHAHPLLDAARFPDTATRRATTVALPVHQELAPDDLERIVAACREPAARRRPPRLELLPGVPAARDVWEALAARSANVFATWEWAAAWAEHLAGDARLTLLLAPRADGSPLALIPLATARERGLRVMRWLGHGPADQLGPVCAPADVPAAARAMRAALAGPAGSWDVLVAEHLPADEGWDALLGLRVAAREASPVVDLPPDGWEAFLAAHGSGLRKQIRYQERRLAREHELRFRLTDDPERLDADFALLRRLHAQRWAPGESDAFRGRRAAFLADFARRALGRGWLRLWFLELDGRAVAGWLGFRYGGVESYYQGGRDRAWDDRSVGAVLVAHTIRAASDDGIREYRFLRGGEAYKARLATRDPGLVTLATAGSATGAAALGAARARRAAARLRA